MSCGCSRCKCGYRGHYKVLRGHDIDGSNGKTQPADTSANHIHVGQAHFRIGWGPSRSQLQPSLCSQRLSASNTCNALGLFSEFATRCPSRRPVHRTAAACWATVLPAKCTYASRLTARCTIAILSRPLLSPRRTGMSRRELHAGEHGPSVLSIACEQAGCTCRNIDMVTEGPFSSLLILPYVVAIRCIIST